MIEDREYIVQDGCIVKEHIIKRSGNHPCIRCAYFRRTINSHTCLLVDWKLYPQGDTRPDVRKWLKEFEDKDGTVRYAERDCPGFELHPYLDDELIKRLRRQYFSIVDIYEY